MAVEIIKLNEASFQREVLEATRPVLVDFTAVWCQPCKMLDPIVRQLADQWEGKLSVFKVDVDENQNLAMDYSVMGVPTLMLFVGGQPVERVTGYQHKDKLEKKFRPHL